MATHTTSKTPTPPAARCPALKRLATPLPPLECTSATVVGAAAARAGIKRDSDGSTILPGLSLLAYDRTVLLPITFRREVNVFHYANGAVQSVLCSGPVAKALDPALGVCVDVGASTRTDRPQVRAWALRAEAAISKSTKAQPSLTSGKLTFLACEDPSFRKTKNRGIAFEMNIYVQHSGSRLSREDCAR